MLNLFKPPVFTTAPPKQSGSDITKHGSRWTRTKYVLVHLAGILPVFLLFAYMTSSSGSKHSNGPAGSALVYLFRESGPILIAIIALLTMVAVLFFATLGRLRDINASPLWAFLFFIPVLVFPLMIFLSVVPGTKGSNKYGDDPREQVSQIDKLRDIVAHKEKSQVKGVQKEESKANNVQEELNLLLSKHDVIKKALRTKELSKVFKKRGSSDKSNSIVIKIGFDKSKSNYYLSVTKLRAPANEIEKQYFLNYQLMSNALYDQTGLLVERFSSLAHDQFSEYRSGPK
jgi:uncharacterized membrane protein YhaH (DUF805 family)